MRAFLTAGFTVAFVVIVLSLGGCRSKPSNKLATGGGGVAPPTMPLPKGGGAAPPNIPPAKGGGWAGNAFLDQKKQIPPRMEWTREVGSRRGGTFTFRVTSQGPFAVTVVTGKGYRAMQTGNKKAFAKADVLLTVDSKELTLERAVTVPAGPSYFILENQTDKNVEFHLQCFAP